MISHQQPTKVGKHIEQAPEASLSKQPTLHDEKEQDINNCDSC